MPRPTPPAGGMPCSSACDEGLVVGLGLLVALRAQALLGLEALALDVRVDQLAEGVGDLHAAGERLPALDQAGLGAVLAASGEISTG